MCRSSWTRSEELRLGWYTCGCECKLSKRCCNVRDDMWAVKAAATVAALALLLPMPVVLTDRNEERRPSMGGKSRRYLSCS